MESLLDSNHTEALSKIITAYEKSIGKCCFYMPTGYGITHIISTSINNILNINPYAKIIVLFKTKHECLQFETVISGINSRCTCTRNVKNHTEYSILAITYNDYFLNYEKLISKKIDVIICFNAEQINSDKYYPILYTECNLLLGVFSSKYYDKNNLFADLPFIYETKNIVFYDSEVQYLENLILPILKHLNYQKIEIDKSENVLGKIINFDLSAIKDNVTYYIDVKAYKGLFNDKKIIRNAIEQTLKSKSLINSNDTYKFGIILLCDVDEKLKQEIVEEFGIFVWDIKNLLYICSKVAELSEKLQDTIPYSLNGIVSVKPIIPIEVSVKSKTSLATESTYGKELILKLKNCKTGTGKTNHSAQEYEEICSSIIKYLFKSEFSQFSEQHKTNDEMFRMDIICSLKGTTAFWEFLMRYYNTKFIVFECKNYKDKLKQNLIYVTDKYLFNPVLRNVAFIISRNGFSNNAQKAALGILKEQGKLIIDLTDYDLEIMINAKDAGNEPSDYLLDKVEKLLMGVGV